MRQTPNSRIRCLPLNPNSESVLDGELHDSRPDIVLNLAESGAVLLTGRHRTWIIRAGRQEIRAVRNIESFRANVHAMAFGDPDGFRERHVEIEVTRSNKCVRPH